MSLVGTLSLAARQSQTIRSIFKEKSNPANAKGVKEEKKGKENKKSSSSLIQNPNKLVIYHRARVLWRDTLLSVARVFVFTCGEIV